MSPLPHDLRDLYLAPVVLDLDAQLEELGQLDAEEFARTVALEGDMPEWTREMRESGFLTALRRTVATRDWDLELTPRGLRVRHDDHSLVLGLPAVAADYLAGASAPKART